MFRRLTQLKGQTEQQAFNPNRNVFAIYRQNRLRENLVSGGVYRRLKANTSTNLRKFAVAALIQFSKSQERVLGVIHKIRNT